MLDDFKLVQGSAYQLFLNSIQNNRVSHAYLIDANGYYDTMSFVKAFVKSIVCPHHFTSLGSCGDCNICRRIDDNNYLELRIIENDDMWLKKEQILDLREEFSYTGIEGKIRIYIIKDCEKMNVSTSNSILKFLEEPAVNVIAILITNNINALLSTIISRCQVIKLNSDYSNLSIDDRIKCLICNNNANLFSSVGYNFVLDSIFNFLFFADNNKFDGIMNYAELLSNKFKKRDELLAIFNFIIYIYYDCLKILVGDVDKIFFLNDVDRLKKIVNNNSVDTIICKINGVDELCNSVRFNVNTNLLFDRLCLVLGGS